MRNKVFNTTFENMLRVLLLTDTLNSPANADRITALDFICIYGKKCKVLDKNLHGDNEFGFAEFTNKREKISEAIKLAVKNDFMSVANSDQGFVYEINERGKGVVSGLDSAYTRAYLIGAKVVCRKFSGYADDELLKYITDLAAKEG